MENDKWQWQAPGGAWRGAALYHVTLTVADRSPVLGRLVVPDGDPARAHVVRTPLGDALVERLLCIPRHQPEVRVLHFGLMPDHLHAVLYVQRAMDKGIAAVVRGFWQGVKKLGRACTAADLAAPNVIRGENEVAQPGPSAAGLGAAASYVIPNPIREELRAASRSLQGIAAELCGQMGNDAYYALSPIFAEKPFIRPMSRYSQLQNTIRHIDMNPQRLATKRQKPSYFSVQRGIDIGGHSYDGVGNVALLQHAGYAPVHVRRAMVEQAQHGDDRALRDYKNSCVLKARQGVVMVSPFISHDEKQVLQVLLTERHLVIILADNGFRDYYKPADSLFDDCAAGRVLILAP